MSGLGLREYLALGLLAVAAVIAFAFFTYNDPEASSGTGSGLEPTPTLAPATPQRGNAPKTSPTPLLRDTLKAPSTWITTPFRLQGETRINEASTARQGLNQQFAQVPFPDFRDGQWGIAAEATVRVTPSIFTLEFETSARVVVIINDKQVLDDQGPGLRKVKLEVEQRDREMTIRIEAFDREGEPFVLRWQ